MVTIKERSIDLTAHSDSTSYSQFENNPISLGSIVMASRFPAIIPCPILCKCIWSSNWWKRVDQVRRGSEKLVGEGYNFAPKCRGYKICYYSILPERGIPM